MEELNEVAYHMNALMRLLPVTLSVPAMRRERPVVAWENGKSCSLYPDLWFSRILTRNGAYSWKQILLVSPALF